MDPFPMCVVCSTSFRYRGPQPHLLPCLHPVCENCLKSTVITTLICSICVKSHDKNDKSFRLLPVDEIISAEVLHLTSKHRPAEFLCTNDEDGNQAVCWCGECGDFLCEHCQVSHSKIKATKNHTVQWMSDISKTTKRSQPLCEKHNQRMDIYDNDCDCFICPRCFYNDHSSHTTKKADELLKKEEDNLNENLESLSTKQEEIVRSSDKVNEQTESIGRKATSLRETVQHTFAQLKALIDQREKEVLVELDQLLDSMRNINNNRRPVLKSSETSCKTVRDYINKTLLYASPCNIHNMTDSIAQAHEICMKADVPTVDKYEPCVVFSKQGLQDLKSSLSSFGCFMTPITQTEVLTDLSSIKSAVQMKLEALIEDLQTLNRDAETQISALKKVASKNDQRIKTLQEDVIRHQRIAIQLLPKGYDKDTCLHVLGKVNDARHVVVCPTMMFDSDRVNRNAAYINDKGLLINSGHPQLGGMKAVDTSGKMLKNYSGTSSTSPMPSSGLVYWEVEADAELDKPLGGGSLVLEVGVCGEEVIDNKNFIGGQYNSCSLDIAHKSENNVKWYVSMDGRDIASSDNVFANKGGTSVTLKYGVLVDTDRMAASFVDTNNRGTLGSGCFGTGRLQHGAGHNKTMWPVFGIYGSRKRVEMQLVSGQDVQMEDWKKQLLEKARLRLSK
ncbi:uncharacterized protein LOC125371580 [Haliotis rufescens]|uniref:uncharacterized protein LOC125371580 n=1 Tax=Haliotis rufescens TaxID=6454 RepID=UPI00201FB370|nr:uncharacterized protein LOC125371580 [Haliotis rufescens]